MTSRRSGTCGEARAPGASPCSTRIETERRAACARGFVAMALAVLTSSCVHAPTPLEPGRRGSVGLPHRGMLAGGEEVPREGDGFRFLRDNDRHFALPRFARAIEHAASSVAHERPGATLVVGDLSTRTGGELMPHLSHRTGRDADLLLYLTTLDGAPVVSPGFVHFGPDGLAWDGKRYLRFDVEREWLLVRALLSDPEARVQWIFAAREVQAWLVEWALSRGEPTEIVWRAQQVMLEPHPGGAHDDHLHVRTACSEDDVAHGCEPSGPERPWLALAPAPPLPSNDDLARELLAPFESQTRVAGGP